MAAWRDSRTVRQRLGSELRRTRDLAGLSGRELAQRMGISQSKVSRLETGVAIPSSVEVAAWSDAVAVPPATRDLLMELTEQALTEVYAWRTTLHDRTHLQAHIQEREREAQQLFAFQSSLVPGLLQTAEYTRRLLSLLHPPYAERDVPAALASRLDRQLMLFEEGRSFNFLITEAALRWRPGPPDVLLAQLDRIASMSTLTNVSIGLIPYAGQALTDIPHGFVIFDVVDRGPGHGQYGADDERPAETIVMVETVHANLTISGENVEPYRHRWKKLYGMAVFGDDARIFLAELGEEIRRLVG